MTSVRARQGAGSRAATTTGPESGAISPVKPGSGAASTCKAVKWVGVLHETGKWSNVQDTFLV